MFRMYCCRWIEQYPVSFVFITTMEQRCPPKHMAVHLLPSSYIPQSTSWLRRLIRYPGNLVAVCLEPLSLSMDSGVMIRTKVPTGTPSCTSFASPKRETRISGPSGLCTLNTHKLLSLLSVFDAVVATMPSKCMMYLCAKSCYLFQFLSSLYFNFHPQSSPSPLACPSVSTMASSCTANSLWERQVDRHIFRAGMSLERNIRSMMRLHGTRFSFDPPRNRQSHMSWM